MALAQSRVTVRGQISVPAEVRRKLGIGSCCAPSHSEKYRRAKNKFYSQKSAPIIGHETADTACNISTFPEFRKRGSPLVKWGRSILILKIEASPTVLS